MHFKKQLKNMFRNSIRLKIGTPAKEIPGGTRFGGAPDVPADFEWPVFTGEWYGEEGKTRKERPLSFLAQFDCAELAAYDADGLLPHTGLLSFFYEVETQRWGYDPKDAGCARVFWFEDAAPLHRMEPPAALRASSVYPAGFRRIPAAENRAGKRALAARRSGLHLLASRAGPGRLGPV